MAHEGQLRAKFRYYLNPIVAKKGLKIVNKEVKKACGSLWNMV
jgi:hypothetical protein